MSARVVRAALALTVGVTIPLGDLALDCRGPASNACAWGRASFPLALLLGVLLLAPLVYGALVLLAMLRRSEHGGEQADADRVRSEGAAAGAALSILALLYIAARELGPLLYSLGWQ